MYWQVILTNPASRVKPPKVIKKEAKYLDDEQVKIMFEKLEHVPIKWRTIIKLFVYTGLRRGELVGLKWDDIDFQKQLLHVRRATQIVKGKGLVDTSTKTTGSMRAMKLPEVV